MRGGSAAPAADLVTSIPGFPAFYFKAYSGYLAVPGPFETGTCGTYDSLAIHYQVCHQDARLNPYNFT